MQGHRWIIWEPRPDRFAVERMAEAVCHDAAWRGGEVATLCGERPGGRSYCFGALLRPVDCPACLASKAGRDEDGNEGGGT